MASYSLYLWHEPIVHRLSTMQSMPQGFVPLVLVSALICMAIAAASYRLIEVPFLLWRRQWQPGLAPTVPGQPTQRRGTMSADCRPDHRHKAIQ